MSTQSLKFLLVITASLLFWCASPASAPLEVKKRRLYWRRLVFACIVSAIGFVIPLTGHAFTISKPSNFLALNTGLVVWWTFDGPDMISNVRDRSGNGNNGYLIGTTTLGTAIATSSWVISGKIGQALRFDGLKQYIQASAPAGIAYANPSTVSLWAKRVSGSPSASAEFFNLEVSNYQILTLGFDSDYNGILTSRTDNTVSSQAQQPSSVVNQFIWHHIVVTNPGGDTAQTLYVDGVLNSMDQGGGGWSEYSNGYMQIAKGITDQYNAPIVVDDVRIYNRALSETEVKQLYRMGGAKISTSGRALTGLNSGLVGWWTFDGPDMKNNVVDKSGSGNTGYMRGFTSTSSAVVPGKIGQALKFDGVNNYIEGPTSDTLNPSQIAIAFWIKVLAAPISNNSIIEKDSLVWRIRCGNTSPCQPQMIHSGVIGASGANLSLNTWAHIVAIGDSTGTQIYTNGVAGTKDTDAYTGAVTVHNLCIGNDCGVWNVNVELDDVRVYSRVLSATEVKQLYSQGGEKISASPRALSGAGSGLVGWWTFDGPDMKNNVVDRSGNGNTGYMMGFTSTSSAQAAGKIGQSVKFSNSASTCVNAGNGSSLNITGAITVSAWVNPVSSAFNRQIAGMSTTGGGSSVMQYALYDSGNNRVGIQIENAALDAPLGQVTDSQTVLNNRWSHLVGTYNGVDTVKIYLNGVMANSGFSADFGAINQSGKNFVIGATHGSTVCNGGYFDGKIDEVRVYNRALSAQEVRQLYRMGK